MNRMHHRGASALRQRAMAAAALAIMVLAGCASSPPTRYHTLLATPAPAAGSAAVVYTGPPLRVRAVQVPPALDRRELVQEVAPGQLEVSEFDHWAAPLARLARQTLAEDLALRLPKDKLVVPGASWPEDAAELSVDILSFRVADGTAVMQLSWSVRRPLVTAASGPAGAAPRPPRGAHLRLQTPAANDAAAGARAWSELLGQAADQVVAALPSAAP